MQADSANPGSHSATELPAPGTEPWLCQTGWFTAVGIHGDGMPHLTFTDFSSEVSVLGRRLWFIAAAAEERWPSLTSRSHRRVDREE